MIDLGMSKAKIEILGMIENTPKADMPKAIGIATMRVCRRYYDPIKQQEKYKELYKYVFDKLKEYESKESI